MEKRKKTAAVHRKRRKVVKPRALAAVAFDDAVLLRWGSAALVGETKQRVRLLFRILPKP